jgi:SAM-dependent methyltransferase
LGWKSEIATSALKKALPFKPLLRRLKRRVVPYRPARDHSIAVRDGIKLVEMLRGCNFDVAGKVGLEVGTGWAPTIPVIHLLCGAKRFYLTDVVRYMDEHTFTLAKQNVLLHAALIERQLGVPQQFLKTSIGGAKTLEGLQLVYLAPIQWDTLMAGSIDYVISRAVLEHVAAREIPCLLSYVYRALKPGGMMANIIDNSDHFQHSDKTIPRLNFLKFSATTWSIICALTDQQNRLRHSDYRRIFWSSDLEIIYDERFMDRDALIALDELAIDRIFSRYDHEDLASLTSYFVLQKPN